LSGFLHDLAKFRARRIMDDRGVNDSRDRARGSGRLVQGLGEVAALDQVSEPLQKLAHVDGGAVQIKEPLGKNRDGNDAARQDGPHEQAPLLDVVDHGPFVLTGFAAHGKPGSLPVHFRFLGGVVGRGEMPGVCRINLPAAS
jgi:hypothetical protein